MKRLLILCNYLTLGQKSFVKRRVREANVSSLSNIPWLCIRIWLECDNTMLSSYLIYCVSGMSYDDCFAEINDDMMKSPIWYLHACIICGMVKLNK